MKRCFSAIVLLVLSGPSLAYDYYACKTMQVFMPNDKGLLEAWPEVNESTTIDFRVNTKSGAISDGMLPNPEINRTVIDNGTHGSAFKVMWQTSHAKTHEILISFIRISTYRGGKLKPFVYTSSERVYAGLCTEE